MKLLLITDTINKAGGIERVISLLSNYFCTKFNYEIEILSIFTKEDDLFFDFNNRIRITHCNKSYKKYKYRFEEMIHFNNLIKDILADKEADIIMTFYSHISKAVLSNKKSIKNTKVVVTEHIDYYESSIKGRIIRNLLYRKADKLVVLTNEYNRLYSRFLKNVITIPNPVSFNTSNKSTVLNKEIIAMGRLENVKRFDKLIDIFKSIESNYKDWRLVIIGSGIEEKNLKRKIAEYNLEGRVILKSFIKNVEPELIKASIYALTSEHEGFGMVLIEAQECGLPCISFDITPSKEIISNNENGILIKQGDIEEYSKQLSALMDDYEKRKLLGQRAKINAKKYNIDIIADRWNKLFLHLL